MGEIDFESYRLFCVVAECESFSKASEKLYISQPAVTQAIKKLEENLGGKVFCRTPKGVKLTDEGRRLYNYIKSSIDTMNNAENKFSQYINLEEGEIRIKTSRSLGNVGIYDAIMKFAKAYPKIRLSVFSGGYIYDSIEQLANGDVDMVAVNLPFECDKLNIQIIECKEVEDCFYASKEYWDGIKNKKNVKELLKTELIVPLPTSATGKILEDFCQKHKIEFVPKYMMTSTNVRKEFVLNGFGIGFGLKNNIAKELEEGKLVEIKVTKNPLLRNIGIAVHSDEMLNNATAKLVEFIKKI